MTSDPYISQTDEAELTRLQNLSAGQGLGDTLYVDDEMSGFMDALGLSEGKQND